MMKKVVNQGGDFLKSFINSLINKFTNNSEKLLIF